jgi:hypothetical protein
MNSWLDKKAYNDARYGAGGFYPGTVVAKEKGGSRFRSGSLFKLRTPSLIVIVLCMMYGGYYAAIMHADYSEVGHQTFKLAFGAITELWGQVASTIGLSGNYFITSVVEFLAVMISLLFALFSSVGGLVVYIFQTVFNS